MSGKIKQKVYQYDLEGKFIKTFESIKELQITLFPGVKGIKNPFLSYNNGKKYVKSQVLINNNILSLNKIGKSQVIKEFKKVNSPYISSVKDNKTVQCLNLNNEIIAEFKNAHFASLLTGIDRTTIFHQLKSGKFSKKDLFFKYK